MGQSLVDHVLRKMDHSQAEVHGYLISAAGFYGPVDRQIDVFVPVISLSGAASNAFEYVVPAKRCGGICFFAPI